MGHVRKQLSEAELMVEIARINEGAKSRFAGVYEPAAPEPTQELGPSSLAQPSPPKKRGRPLGSKNKPK